MKKMIFTLLTFLLVQEASAKKLFDQLCAFNYNWNKYESHIPQENARSYRSDVEYIQTHLSFVIELLRNNELEGLSNEQIETRTLLINELEAYKNRALFPINYYRLDRIPVFIDEHGTHCAVGHLLEFTGHDDIAQRISNRNNYIWVEDIQDQDVIEWQESSGLTFEELKIIQGAYDSYLDGAFFHPNKYEIPQKPEPILAYFDGVGGNGDQHKDEAMIWCRGEGKNGIIHGKWEQNAGKDMPWIVGYFHHGKRTGQWKEYYQGTKQLCRTENWRNDKLNGVRKRFDREGKLIEEITFKNGEAVTKVNYDFHSEIKFIRTPLDSNLVYTEIFSFGGGLLASGKERIHNPSNLLWFQNIELTALNSASITSRDNGLQVTGLQGNAFSQRLYSAPSLVKYKKEGDWIYYKQFNAEGLALNAKHDMNDVIKVDYQYYANDLLSLTQRIEPKKLTSSIDSIKIAYEDNYIQDFYAFAKKGSTHIKLDYYPATLTIANLRPYQYYRSRFPQEIETVLQLKSIGEVNDNGSRIGTWNHYDLAGQLAKTENYIIPWKEEENDVSSLTE